MSEDSSNPRWKDLVAALTVALAGLSGLLAAWEDFRKKLQGIGKLDPLALGVAGGLFLVVAVYLQRDRLTRRSKLLRPDALRLRPEEHFVGRAEEVEALLQNCSEWPLVWLVGESGAGKSSLLRYGLLPRLKGDPRWVPAYVARWGVDWIEGPLAELAAVLPRSGEGGGAPRDLEALGQALRGLAERGTAAVLLFDQFDDYQARHVDRFREGFNLLSPELLATRNPFWRLIRQLLDEGVVRCLFATRSDTAWALESIRFREPKVQFLERLSSGHALELLETLAATGDGVVRYPQNGFDQLKLILAGDLEESGRSLPIQMKVAFQGLRHLPHLTPGAYRRQGGLLGLEIGHVQGHLEAAAQFSGLDLAALRPVLLALADPVTRKTVPRPEAALLALLPERMRAPERLRQALSHLEEKEVVRRTFTPEEAESWQLDHDYLCRAVLALEQREARWQKLLDDSARAFEQAPGLWGRWKVLLSPAVQLRLVWEKVRGRLRYGKARRFVLWSSPRLVLNLVVLLAVGVALALQQVRTEIIAEEIFNVFDTQEGLSYREADAVWQIATEGPPVRRRLFEKFLASDENSLRFTKQPLPITQAILGSSLQQSFPWLEEVIVNHCYIEIISAQRMRACAHLIAEASRAPNFSGADTLAKDLIARMQKEEDADSLEELARILAELGPKIASQQVFISAGQRLVSLMEKEREPLKLAKLAIGLRTLGPKFDERQSFSACQRLVTLAEKEENSYKLDALAIGLAALGPRLNTQQAFNAGQHLVKQMEKAESAERFADLAENFAMLGPNLDALQALRTTNGLVDRIQKANLPLITLVKLERSLTALRSRLNPQEVLSVGERLVGQLEKTEEPDRLATLARGLAELGPKFDSQQAGSLRRHLVGRMEKEENPYMLAALAMELTAVGLKLDAKQALSAAERLVGHVEKEKDKVPFGMLFGGMEALGPQLDSRHAFDLTQQLQRDKWDTFVGAKFALLQILAKRLDSDEQRSSLLCEVMRADDFAEVQQCDVASTLLTGGTLHWEAEDLLKWPTCSEADRVLIARHLATSLANAPADVVTKGWDGEERVNRWAVAAWLHQQGFDTERPPLRGAAGLDLCR
jgi:conflict system STAND superfamily ATPase